jgi:ATP-binding protein involved in chromosome partitioning
MPTPQEILEELKHVRYPGYTRDIVSFGIVKDIEIASAGITVTLSPAGVKPEVIDEIRAAIKQKVQDVTGTDQVDVVLEKGAEQAPRMRRGRAEVPGIRHIIAVASGKGGVGKSTVAANLALALHTNGYRVGLLDADVHGPSIPLMLGVSQRPESDDDNRIQPLEKFGIKVISLGLFIAQRTPVIWRGPMINKLLTQFLREVEWGELDYLVLDLPPGTGDAQLTIVQQVPLSGGVIVTTPQDVALLDVQRGIAMFKQVNTPVLGVVENMSYHVCSGCGDRAEIFGHGGGAKMAEQFGIPLLGELPLNGAIRAAGDDGTPIVVAQPDAAESRAFRDIAVRVAKEAEEHAANELPTIH